MQYNRFKFLANEWPTYFSLATKIEDNLTTNPDISLIHIRDLANAVLIEIVNLHRISCKSTDMNELLTVASENSVISAHLKLKFELIKTSWEQSLQLGYDDRIEATKLYENIFEIMCWYTSHFGKHHHTEYTKYLLLSDRVMMLEFLLEAALENKSNAQPISNSLIQQPTIPQVQTVQTKTYSEDEINHLKKLVKQGDTEANYELATFYLTVYEEMEDESFYELAVELFKQACHKQHLQSFIPLLNYLEEDEMDALLEKLDFNKLKDQAISNNSHAQFLLGWIYKNGLYSEDETIEIDADTDLAMRWMKKASQNGFSFATEQLAYIYFENEQFEECYALLKSFKQSNSIHFKDQFDFTYGALSFYFKAYSEGIAHFKEDSFYSLPEMIIESFAANSIKLYKNANNEKEINTALQLMNYACIHKPDLTVEICGTALHSLKTEAEKVSFIQQFTQTLEFDKFKNYIYRSTIYANLGEIIGNHSNYISLINEGITLLSKADSLGSSNAKNRIKSFLEKIKSIQASNIQY